MIRNVLRVDDSLPYRDGNGFVKEGRIILRLLDEDGSSRAFRLSIPEALELAKLLEIASDEQLRRLVSLNAERTKDQRNKALSKIKESESNMKAKKGK